MIRACLLACVTLALGGGSLFAQASATAYGTGCGPTLSGSLVPNGGTLRASVTIDNALPDTPVLMIVGTQEFNIPVPGYPGCSFYTDIVFPQTHRTNSQGTYTYSRALPSGSVGDPLFFIQYVEISFDGLGNPLLRWTNGVRYAAL
ncbi:MAG: hypothetical protein H6833_12340 [Planctomycetes bacterium]|nr:hypothetical protein [Planctomycetota bacterium]